MLPVESVSCFDDSDWCEREDKEDKRRDCVQVKNSEVNAKNIFMYKHTHTHTHFHCEHITFTRLNSIGNTFYVFAVFSVTNIIYLKNTENHHQKRKVYTCLCESVCAFS